MLRLKRMVWVAALAVSSAHAQPEDSERTAEVAAPTSQTAQALEVRLARLREAAKRADSVRTAVEQAELALTRAREARQRGEDARAERAEQIADAATSLAERRFALVREREAMRIARARLEEAHRAQAVAREALETTMQRSTEAR